MDVIKSEQSKTTYSNNNGSDTDFERMPDKYRETVSKDRSPWFGRGQGTSPEIRSNRHRL